ncbi:MAG: alpha/beta hydrolase [Saprospiraceae bacterium]|nr:alpha/beta hydrolase [Saprospiraceae bacterium]
MKALIAKGMGAYLNTLSVISPKRAGKKGFYFFCLPFAAKLKEHQTRFLDTSKSFTFSFEEQTIQGYKWGSGPENVLFLHGWASNSFRWKKYIEFIDKEKFTVYCIDAQAHGNSSGKILNIPIYSRLIEHFLRHVQPVNKMVSHSVGSISSLYCFKKHPELAPERLVIMGSPGMAIDFFDYYKDALGLSDKTVQLTLDYFRAHLGKEPEFYSAMDFANGLSSKGLIIHDTEDEDVPVRYGRAISASWPNADYWETTGFGHKLKDAEVVKRVLAFIA